VNCCCCTVWRYAVSIGWLHYCSCVVTLNNWLNVFTGRKTKVAIGAEELLLHFAIRLVGLVLRPHSSLDTSDMCTAPTGTLQMTTGVTESIRSPCSLRIAIPVMSIHNACICQWFKIYPSKRTMYCHV